MEQLLDGLVPGLPDATRRQILERAEGVPLYAVETVRMLLDCKLIAERGSSYQPVGEIGELDVPETLHALIAARLDGLPPQERRLLQDGAVLGKSFTRDALAALAEEAAQLSDDPLERAQLLYDAGTSAQAAADMQGAERLLAESVALYDGAGEGHRAARVSARLAFVVRWQGRFDEAIAMTERAYDLLK